MEFPNILVTSDKFQNAQTYSMVSQLSNWYKQGGEWGQILIQQT